MIWGGFQVKMRCFGVEFRRKSGDILMVLWGLYVIPVEAEIADIP